MIKTLYSTVVILVIFFLIFSIFALVAISEENLPALHFEAWKIADITARTRSSKRIAANIDAKGNRIHRYKIWYAISNGSSFVDWDNPDSKGWTLLSDSSSNIATIKEDWGKYNGKYLLVKGKAYYGEGKVVISNYFTKGFSEYIDSMYIIPQKGREPPPGIDSELKIEQLTDSTHVLIQFYQHPSAKESIRIAEMGIHLMEPADGIYYTATLPAKKIGEIIRDRAIRYIGPISPNGRLSPYLRENNFVPWNLKEDGTLVLVIKFFKDVFLEEAKKLIGEKYKYSIVGKISLINALIVEGVNKEEVLSLANEDIGQWIEEAPPPPIPELNESRPKINADDAHSSPYNLDGTGIDVMIYDEGKISHPDFGARGINADNEVGTISDHSTHVSGIVGGATTTQPYYGIAPNVDIIGYDFVGDKESEYSEAINHATHSVEMANNSWGTAVSAASGTCGWMGDYNTTAELFDNIVRGATDTPIPVVFAAGNERDDGDCGVYPNDPPNYYNNYKTIDPPHPAKNIIAVGATNSDDDSMTEFSSWGPVDDGRLRPDVVAPGCEKTATSSVGIKSTIPAGVFTNNISKDCDGTGDDYCFPYDVMCGTSMAAPHVTGALALMLQYYWSTHGTETNPLPSTLKAIVIHTAEDMVDGTTTYYTTGPDYASGYGRIDVFKAIQWIQKDNATDGIYILEGSVTEGATDTFSFEVASGQSAVKVTVAWDDEAGTASSTKHLKNDIDIKLINPNGNTRYPWVLEPDFASQAAHPDVNTLDNVEQVYFPSPSQGIWRLKVSGTDFVFATHTQSYSIVTDFPLGEPKHAIWDSASNAVAIFGYDGNLYLKGTLTDYATSGCLTPTATAEFIIQTATDTVKAIINSSTGNMCIAGSVNENQTSITSPADREDFIVQDKDSNNVALISKSGDLYLKGEVYEESIP